MSRRRVILAFLAGLLCFALGVGATRLLGWGPPASPTAAASDGGSAAATFLVEDAGLRLMMPVIDSDGGGKEPRILIDPGSINLLPDASLRLDPALLGDAGAP
jgi:hypothetical protein